MSCGEPPSQGAWVPVQPSSVTHANACQFICNEGYVPDGQGTSRACYKNPDTRSIFINKDGTPTLIGEKRRTYKRVWATVLGPLQVANRVTILRATPVLAMRNPVPLPMLLPTREGLCGIQP